MLLYDALYAVLRVVGVVLEVLAMIRCVLLSILEAVQGELCSME